MGDNERWEARYRRGDAPTPVEPSETLRNAVGDLPVGRALDVATGAGRDALFLASRGYTVDAVDVSQAALALARERAVERGLQVNWIRADVDTFPLPERRYDVVSVSRFDVRSRLDDLAQALVVGGVFVYEGFLVGGDGGPPDRYRFEPGELRTAFSEFDLLQYEEDDGRVSLVARRPA